MESLKRKTRAFPLARAKLEAEQPRFSWRKWVERRRARLRRKATEAAR